MTKISSPLTLPNGHILPNRIGKSATSEAMADRATGEPTNELIQLYHRWVRGGACILIPGNAALSLDARIHTVTAVV